MVREHINAEDSYVRSSVALQPGGKSYRWRLQDLPDAPAEYQTDGGLAESDVVSQAEAALENMAKVARAAGGALADVVKTTVYTREGFREHSDALRAGRSCCIALHPRLPRWSALPIPTTFPRLKQQRSSIDCFHFDWVRVFGAFSIRSRPTV